MKRFNKKVIFFLILSLLLFSVNVFASSISSIYIFPIDNSNFNDTVQIQTQFDFWGIFHFNLSFFTLLTWGSNNIFNIKNIEPLGILGIGSGMNIPLGDFYFKLDWEYLFSNISHNGFSSMAQSFSYGIRYSIYSSPYSNYMWFIDFYYKNITFFSEYFNSNEVLHFLGLGIGYNF